MVVGIRAIVVAAALAAVGVIGLTGSAQARAPQSPAFKECPAGESITVTAPAASAPTTVSVAVAPPVNLKPAKDADESSYHLHYFVDTDPATIVQAGQAVPAGNPKIIHSAALTQDVGALSAGKHTVTVVMGDVAHLVCNPVVQGSVSFDVSAAALPRTGTAGPSADNVGGSWLWLVLATGGAAAASGVALRRRTGA